MTFDKKSLALSIIPIVVSIFVIITSTDNVWNSPKFDIELSNISQNEEGMLPVDEIVRTIYDEKFYKKLTADWIRDRDVESLRFLEEQFTPDDAWILNRIYHNNETNGLSQQIIIKNDGYAQANDIIIQILGTDNFKIIDYTCPEIMSPDQISKEHGQKYLIIQSRMSVQLTCEIIINSVGNNGVKQVIITAHESHPAVWPDDKINNIRNTLIYLNIVLYASIIFLVYVVSYNVVQYLRKNKIDKVLKKKL